jgi:Ser/Thr protein kinase RdoA (MazF antagonist)
VLRLDSDRGPFVLRVSHPTNTAAALLYEHRLLQFMSRQISEVPAPITTRTGATYLAHDGRLLTLFPFMPGRMLDEQNEAECLAAAHMFARLQKAGLAYPDAAPRPDKPRFCELNWEDNHWWRWQAVESLLFLRADAVLAAIGDPTQRALAAQIFARRELIARAREELRDWVVGLRAGSRPLLSAPTHCDYWSNNILVQDGQISAVVDWDGCKVEWLFYALGRATWDFCKTRQGHRLDYPKAVRFLQAYCAAGGPVPLEEFDLLVPVMRGICLIEVLLGLQEAEEAGFSEQVLDHLLWLECLQRVAF